MEAATKAHYFQPEYTSLEKNLPTKLGQEDQPPEGFFLCRFSDRSSQEEMGEEKVLFS